MAVTGGELAAVLREITDAAARWRVKKIYQPRREELVFTFAESKLSLFISADRRFGRIHFAAARSPGAETPASFALLLRKHLCGKRITGCERHPGERQFFLLFGDKRLFVKLFGAGGFLLAEGDGTVLGASGFGDGPAVKAGEKFNLPPAAGLEEAEAVFNVSPSAALEKIYVEKTAAARREELRAQTLSRARSEIKRLTRLVEGLEADRAKLEGFAAYRHYGDLCRTWFHELKRGLSKIMLTDPATGQGVEIPLSPELSPAENVEGLYRKYKKSVSGLAKLEKAIAAARARMGLWQKELQSAEAGEVAAGGAELPPPAGKKEKKEEGGFRRFVSAEGFEILVGRNDRQNDDLVRHSNGNDLWFHVRDFPGSHVVVRTAHGRGAVPPGTLAEAARLALKYSTRAQDGKGTVVYTQVKYLRRPKGGPPGKVLVTQEKTIHAVLAPGGEGP